MSPHEHLAQQLLNGPHNYAAVILTRPFKPEDFAYTSEEHPEGRRHVNLYARDDHILHWQTNQTNTEIEAALSRIVTRMTANDRNPHVPRRVEPE